MFDLSAILAKINAFESIFNTLAGTIGTMALQVQQIHAQVHSAPAAPAALPAPAGEISPAVAPESTVDKVTAAVASVAQVASILAEAAQVLAPVASAINGAPDGYKTHG